MLPFASYILRSPALTDTLPAAHSQIEDLTAFRLAPRDAWLAAALHQLITTLATPPAQPGVTHP